MSQMTTKGKSFSDLINDTVMKSIKLPADIDWVTHENEVQNFPIVPLAEPFDPNYYPEENVERMERTLIMIKPDGVQRGLCGEILKRFEQRGFKLVASKMVNPTLEQAELHYDEHNDKGTKGGGDFFRRMVDAIMVGPMFALVYEAPQAISVGRGMIGHSGISPSGTIRGDFATVEPYNVIHGSDSHNATRREIEIWFGDDLQLIHPDEDLAFPGYPKKKPKSEAINYKFQAPPEFHKIIPGTIGNWVPEGSEDKKDVMQEQIEKMKKDFIENKSFIESFGPVSIKLTEPETELASAAFGPVQKKTPNF